MCTGIASICTNILTYREGKAQGGGIQKPLEQFFEVIIIENLSEPLIPTTDGHLLQQEFYIGGVELRTLCGMLRHLLLRRRGIVSRIGRWLKVLVCFNIGSEFYFLLINRDHPGTGGQHGTLNFALLYNGLKTPNFWEALRKGTVVVYIGRRVFVLFNIWACFYLTNWQEVLASVLVQPKGVQTVIVSLLYVLFSIICT